MQLPVSKAQPNKIPKKEVKKSTSTLLFFTFLQIRVLFLARTYETKRSIYRGFRSFFGESFHYALCKEMDFHYTLCRVFTTHCAKKWIFTTLCAEFSLHIVQRNGFSLHSVQKSKSQLTREKVKKHIFLELSDNCLSLKMV